MAKILIHICKHLWRTSSFTLSKLTKLTTQVLNPSTYRLLSTVPTNNQSSQLFNFNFFTNLCISEINMVKLVFSNIFLVWHVSYSLAKMWTSMGSFRWRFLWIKIQTWLNLQMLILKKESRKEVIFVSNVKRRV